MVTVTNSSLSILFRKNSEQIRSMAPRRRRGRRLLSWLMVLPRLLVEFRAEELEEPCLSPPGLRPLPLVELLR